MYQLHVTSTSLRWYKEILKFNSFRNWTEKMFTWKICRIWYFLWKNLKLIGQSTNVLWRTASCFPFLHLQQSLWAIKTWILEQFTKKCCTSNISTFSWVKRKGFQPLQSHQQMLYHPTTPVVGQNKVKEDKKQETKIETEGEIKL